jgi:RNA polymerase sigma factor (sigma-70 family)
LSLTLKGVDLPGAGYPDDELAERVSAGAVDLWAALAGRVLEIVRPIVKGEVRNRNDWEDVQQDCLLRFFKALPSYTSEKGALRVFVGVLARRQVIDYHRKLGRQVKAEDTEVLLQVAEEAAARGNPGPGLMSFIEGVVGAEAARAVHLRVFDGYKYNRVGKELGKSEAAAKMQVRKALAALRRYMEAADA